MSTLSKMSRLHSSYDDQICYGFRIASKIHQILTYISTVLQDLIKCATKMSKMGEMSKYFGTTGIIACD